MTESNYFRVEDIAKIKKIDSLQLSPDGSHILYTLGTMNLEENKHQTDIYVGSIDGEKPKRLTNTGKVSLPSWSPDSDWIAFSESGEKGNTIYVIGSDGENKRKITEYRVSNSSLGIGTIGNALKWSPDGTQIAFLASLEPYDKDAKIKVIDRVMYKAFYGNSDMRRRHIFTVSTLGNQAPKQVTFGDYDEHSITWNPDGKEIMFVSNRTGYDDLNMNLDIYTVDIKSHEINQLTDTEGAIYAPNYSPDGTKIAYLHRTRANTSNESTPEDNHLWVMNSYGSDQKDLTTPLDRPVGGTPEWLSNEEILVTASNHGRTPIYRFKLDGKIDEYLSGKKTHGNITTRNNVIAYTWNDPVTPSEIYVYKDGKETQLTNYNDLSLQLSIPEEFWIKTKDGYNIQGWIIKPPDMDPSQKYPTLLNIKGGPSGMRGYSWNPSYLAPAAQGFVQVYINYRGSSGYGQEFTDAVVGDMLGGEYRDNIQAIDHAVKNYPFIDESRLGVWGGSYGGYLTNWAITQTDRFKAAVAISSISNLWSQWGCSAIPLWMEVELGGLPWEHPERMYRQSPLFHVANAKTPTLFLHGEMDNDTPICEAEQMFMALKKLGVETQMVRYVDDGHGIRKKPVNQLDSLRRAIAWFKKYL